MRTGTLVECVLKDGEPYYKIYADLYQCPGSYCRVLLPAERAMIEHWQDGYASIPVSEHVRLT